MDKRFQEVLDDCLERLSRGEALEAVLSLYPEARPELEPLLRAALLTQQALGGIAPSPGARARVWTHLQPAMREKSRPRPTPFLWLRPWAVAVASFLLVLFLAGGTVLASSSSLPHQPLYRVKLAVEQVRVAFTPTQTAKARLELLLAEKRAREMVAMARLNRPEELEKLASQLEGHLEKVAGPAFEAATPSPLPAEAPAPLAAPSLQVTPTPAPEASPSPSPQPWEAPAALAVPSPQEVATPEAAATPQAVPAPPSPAEALGEGAKLDKAAKPEELEPEKEARPEKSDLEARLEEGANLQRQLLEENLEKVPLQARQALKRALEKNRENYLKALERLQEKQAK